MGIEYKRGDFEMENNIEFLRDVQSRTLSKCVGLYDSRIKKIDMVASSVTFIFDVAYMYCNEKETKLKGNITFEKVDMDFSGIRVFHKEDEDGSFVGREYSFEDFLKKYHNYELEIITDTYNGYKINWEGYFCTVMMGQKVL